MSPLQIKILLHYYACTEDYNGIEPHSFIKELGDMGMLGRACGGGRTEWKLTERAQCYIEYILNVPLPTQKWLIKERGNL